MYEVLSNTIVKCAPASLMENASVQIFDSNMMVAPNQQMILKLKTEQKFDNILSTNQYQQNVMASYNIHFDQKVLDALSPSKLMPKGSPNTSKQNKNKLGIQVGYHNY